MALLHTPTDKIALQAPEFNLRGTDEKNHTLNIGENGLAVFFICNHCPYVLAIIDRLVTTAKTLQDNNIKVIAIMPNDTGAYPEDSFENMQKFANEHNFTFPYLIDETQETAKAYDAICTPDLFGFNQHGELQYRGRLDSAANQPANQNTVPEFQNAMLEIAKTGQGPDNQNPSMGCSIKWRV